jgi:hypothetical protein
MIQLLLVGLQVLHMMQFAGAGVGISAISIATVNGLQGSSSGGNSPVITLSTTLAAGPVKSNGLERLYRKQLLLGGGSFWNSCSREWWYRAVSFTSGLLRGNNVERYQWLLLQILLLL